MIDLDYLEFLHDFFRTLQAKSRYLLPPQKKTPTEEKPKPLAPPSISNAPHLAAFEKYLADQEKRIQEKKNAVLTNRNSLPIRAGKQKGEGRDWSAPIKSSRGLLPSQVKNRKRRKMFLNDDASASRSNEISEDGSDGGMKIYLTYTLCNFPLKFTAILITANISSKNFLTKKKKQQMARDHLAETNG